MKVSENWLREIVNTDMSCEKIAGTLTMVGFEVEEITKVNDVNVMDVHINANRGDTLSMAGIAREVATFSNSRMTMPTFSITEDENLNIDDFIKIRVDDHLLCPRYAGRVIKNVKVTESPEWLKRKIIEMGMKPINNVVDITNFVMLELGQPLHAFDLSTINGAEIIIRTAKAGEELITLDEVKRELQSNYLVIANKEKPMVLAGIMGGAEYEITENTTDVFLESACFERQVIRKTARREGLSTESSYRFERVVDAHGVVSALNRAAVLINEIADGHIATGIIDIVTELPKTNVITTKYARINNVLGTNIDKTKMIDILTKLEMEIADNGDSMTITVPTFRADIIDEWDIFEEVARHYGYQNIEATVPGNIIKSGRVSPEIEFENRLRDALAMSGLFEGLSYSLFDLRTLSAMNIQDDSAIYGELVPISNPKSEEYTHLRPTMLISAIESLSNNARRGMTDVQIFEIGRIFKNNNESFSNNYKPRDRKLDANTKVISTKGMPGEYRAAMIAAMGKGFSGEWNNNKIEVDFYWMKGILEQVFASLNINDVKYELSANPSLHPTRTAKAVHGDKVLAMFGQLHSKTAENFDLPQNSFVAEIYTEELMRAAEGAAKLPPLSRFPATSRDISFVVKQDVPASKVKDIIIANSGENLENLTLFDLYKGKGIGDDEVSLAYHLTFRNFSRTLSDEEIDAAMTEIMSELQVKVNAKQR